MTVFWNDIDKVKPEKHRHIFYISKECADRCYSEGERSYPDTGDIEVGVYYGGNEVEWHYDMPDIEFKWWSYVPKFGEKQ